MVGSCVAGAVHGLQKGGRGDEPRRWVRLPCALASSLHARSTALYVSWSTGRAVSFDPVHSGCTVQALGVAV